MKRTALHRSLRTLFAVGALAFSGIGALSAPPAASLPFGEDLAGRPLARLAPSGTRVVVLYFAATDCPISNRYLPDIAALQSTFDTQGVQVLSVYPNPADTSSVVAAHARQFNAEEHPILDRQQSLVRLTHARMTPEAAVLVPAATGWRVVYLGRIDDRYLSLGTERPAATRHDLQDAVRAALAHRPVPPPGGPAVGCSIIPLPA